MLSRTCNSRTSKLTLAKRARAVIACVIPLLSTIGCAQNSAPRQSRSHLPRPKTLDQAVSPASQPGAQVSHVADRRTLPLHVVTYNIHLLPDIAAHVAGKRSEPKYRAQAIAEQLTEYDIIGICEAFDRKHTQTFLDEFHANSSTPFVVAKGPTRSGSHMIGGGLLLLSRFPIEETHTTTYSHASRFLTSGFKADGFAAKGALHARVRLGSDDSAVVDCFLTHLESQSKSAREKQIEELAEFITVHSTKDNPIMVMGDFNVTADDTVGPGNADSDTPYQRLCSALSHNGRELVDVGRVCQQGNGGTSDALGEDGGRRIDYIFVSDPKATLNTRFDPIEARTLPMLDSEVPEASLSDHLAVACRTDFRWTGDTAGENEVPSRLPSVSLAE